jgi:hypothetical protein
MSHVVRAIVRVFPSWRSGWSLLTGHWPPHTTPAVRPLSSLWLHEFEIASSKTPRDLR